ncbi:SPFH domain-containing protein [Sporolactobacillus shoreicorticis]|uniref:SPFH domain-containing protein n=1 Tax=Sporolactobacillus shoreicorticis TaxID=1923877 RepID=A0ABW5S841_9BACL|nr:SPFH domain-containing protein [Sporolactobacillus shoreicorticis]MCO7125930.1 SPFH domain-containing protein [Sporolactobacillus shoreicorticis]
MTEQNAWKMNGFLGILAVLILIGIGVAAVVREQPLPVIIAWLLASVLMTGFTIVPPNKTKVVTFFGKYVGSIRTNGIYLTIPLTVKKTVSLRVRNFNSQKLKVNDVEGNPIEIAAVVVFKVIDSAKALFDVDDYSQFVEIQSETAIRHIASQYPYDNFNEEGLSLRSNSVEISTMLRTELQERLALAGVEVIETRLTHLAYSTEVAQAMLQRQQASAIISARKKIVEGAVGMAQMAIQRLQEEHVVELDEERKVAMINNLMVAIVSDKGSQPVINTGSLY